MPFGLGWSWARAGTTSAACRRRRCGAFPAIGHSRHNRGGNMPVLLVLSQILLESHGAAAHDREELQHRCDNLFHREAFSVSRGWPQGHRDGPGGRYRKPRDPLRVKSPEVALRALVPIARQLRCRARSERIPRSPSSAARDRHTRLPAECPARNLLGKGALTEDRLTRLAEINAHRSPPLCCRSLNSRLRSAAPRLHVS
jgi:hypothetical protein